MHNYYDCFISYGRANSKNFAIKLTQRLEQENLKIWFDQNDIPPAVDWQEQINSGIERADNFLFIISPHSVKSLYCSLEIELAVKYNKRILPLLHINSDAEYDLMHPIIKKRHWLLWLESDHNFDFEQNFNQLLITIQEDANYVRQHTQCLVSALQWQRNQQQTKYLLIGEDRVKAESWLQVKFSDIKQQPCIPTDLHCQYICESTKNAHNLLTQVFICHNEKDHQHREKFVQALNRQAITSWTNKTDIQTGTEFQEEINKGIEGADNLVYLLSPNSVSCTYCLRELAHALKHDKRIIPILIESLDLSTIPNEIKDVQFIDFTSLEKGGNLDELIKVIKQEANYYEKHKILLVKALKWKAQNNNRSLLLRGYNLQHFEVWLNTGLSRKLHPPLPLHSEFINASKGQNTEEVLDVFVSYSQADSDFARKLNDRLQELGKTTWLDQESIAQGSQDFKKEIEKGIESSDNFVFIITPQSVNSPYCADEVEHAFMLNKRFVTILLNPVENKKLHPALARVQWIDFRKDEFYIHFNELVRVLDTDRDHLRNHSKWTQKALEWQEKKKTNDLLLRGTELENAQNWFKETEAKKLNPPATELQKQYFNQSKNLRRKNRRLIIGSIAGFIAIISTALVGATILWLRAERQTLIATLRENAARAENLASSGNNSAESLILAISATGKSQDKLNEVMDSVENSLLKTTQTIQEKNLFLGHTEGVSSVKFSPDGKYIVSGSRDGNIRLWDLKGNLVSKPFQGHEYSVVSVAFSPDGKYIASAGGVDRTIRLWDLKGNPVGQWLVVDKDRITGSVNSVAFSPDGKYIVSGSSDKTIRLWNLKGNPVGKPFQGHEYSVESVTFSPDGKYIASISDDDVIRLWDLKGNPIGKPFIGHTSWVRSIAFSPDGKYIVSGSMDNTIRLWDLKGNPVGKPFVGHTGSIESLAFSPDGKYIVSGGDDSDMTIRLWDLKGNPIGKPFIGHTDRIDSVAFSLDGKYIVSGSHDKTIRLWDLKTNFIGKPLNVHKESVISVTFSSDGKYIVSDGDDNTIRLWDLDGNPVGKPFIGHKKWITSLALSPDGKYIASSSADNTIRLWDLKGNLVGKPFIGHTNIVLSVAFSPNSKYIVSGSVDKTIRLWDLKGNSVDKPFVGHMGSIKSLAFSPDGKYIVSGGSYHVKDTGNNGFDRFISSRDNTIRLWDLKGNPIGKPFEGDEFSINFVAFSPDGKYILSGGGLDKTIRLWDLKGNPIGKPFQGHTGSVNSVAFSPDGKYIISGSADNSIRLWDLKGNPVGKPFYGHKIDKPLTGHTDSVYSVAFSPDGKYIVSSSADKTIRLWDFEFYSWKIWLKSGCDWLKNHSALKNPQTETQKEARAACDKYAWQKNN